MGDEYNMHIHQKRTFLPMLCSRPSIKDVAHPKRCHQDSSTSISGDPLSPRVSCMGQVKRNNRVSGFPSIPHKLVIPSRTNSSNAEYWKLKKLLSGRKNISGKYTSQNSMTCAEAGIFNDSNNKGMQEVRVVKDSENGVGMSVVGMDPPLPVIKKEPKFGNSGQESENLWKRRCRGATSLKTLELQQLQLSLSL